MKAGQVGGLELSQFLFQSQSEVKFTALAKYRRS